MAASFNPGPSSLDTHARPGCCTHCTGLTMPSAAHGGDQLRRRQVHPEADGRVRRGGRHRGRAARRCAADDGVADRICRGGLLPSLPLLTFSSFRSSRMMHVTVSPHVGGGGHTLYHWQPPAFYLRGAGDTLACSERGNLPPPGGKSSSAAHGRGWWGHTNPTAEANGADRRKRGRSPRFPTTARGKPAGRIRARQGHSNRTTNDRFNFPPPRRLWRSC